MLPAAASAAKDELDPEAAAKTSLANIIHSGCLACAIAIMSAMLLTRSTTTLRLIFSNL